MNNVHKCDFISSPCNLTPPKARYKTSPTAYFPIGAFTSRSCNLKPLNATCNPDLQYIPVGANLLRAHVAYLSIRGLKP